MKQKFFIDFDEVLVESSMAFCEVYNSAFHKHPNFVPANYSLNKKWDFSDVCPLLQPGDVNKVFSSRDFFQHLKPQFYCQEVLEKWKDKYEYYLVSIGTKDNLKHKLDYVGKHFPMIQNLILLETNGQKMDKSVINMMGNDKCNLFIDDHEDNLFSVEGNVNIPILFKSNGNKEWNSKWDGLTSTNWLEVDELLKLFYHDKYKVIY